MLTIKLPYPQTKPEKTAFLRRYGLNAYYAGKHWAARKKDADALHTMTLVALRRAKVPKKLLTAPVEVRFSWDDGLDIDNHAVLGKAIVDALKGYLLPDDSPKWFRRVTHEFWDGGAIRVEIDEYKPPKEETTT